MIVTYESMIVISAFAVVNVTIYVGRNYLPGWKTDTTAALVTVFGVLQSGNWIDLVNTAQIAGWVGMGIGFTMWHLSRVTKRAPK